MSGICKGTVWGTEMEKSPVLTVQQDDTGRVRTVTLLALKA